MNMPNRVTPPWLPRPGLSLLLAVCWLLLQQSIALPDVLVAAVLAVAIPKAVHPLLGPVTPLRNPRVALRLVFRVLWDIVVSNVKVAVLVLNPLARPQPVWVCMPLRLRSPMGLAALASIITMTPGTVSCVVDDDSHTLWVHALDARDAEGLAADMAQRYEQPLLEIFG